MLISIVLILVLALLLLRVPVAFSLLIPSLVYVTFDNTVQVTAAVQQSVSGVNSFVLLAVPMFILLGSIANHTGISDRMFNSALTVFGNVKGSLGYVNIATSFSFSWMSGTAITDAATMGRIHVPAMTKRGYSPEFALGLTSAASLIAPMLPPSVPAIIYALAAGVSVTDLFWAGIVPALLLVIVLLVMVFIYSRNKEETRYKKTTCWEKLLAVLKILPPMGAVVIILGGILTGTFTPTEASVAGVVYMFVLGLIYGKINLKTLGKIFRESIETSGSILLIVISAALFGWVLARERVPQQVAEFTLTYIDNPVIFLLVLNLILLVIGAFLEPTSAQLILVPVLAPIGLAMGIDPIHLGIVIIFNLMLGLLTPPVGLVLFVLSGTTKYPVTTVLKGVVPFYIPMLVVLMIITLFPDLILIFTK